MPDTAYLRDKIGSARLTPNTPMTAGSLACFDLIYTAGFFGIDDTGSIKIVTRFASDMGIPQFDDPGAANYTTIKASNAAVLEYHFDVKNNVRPWDKTLYIKVAKGFLKQGDRITIRYGEPSGGSKGMAVQTFCQDAFEFKVLVDAFATYQYTEVLESPVVIIVPGPAVTWRAVLPTLRRCGQEFRLALKAEDRWGNPSNQIDAVVHPKANMPVNALPETVTLKPGQFSAIIEGLSVDSPGDLAFDVLDSSGNLLAKSNPLRIVSQAQLMPFWADMHGQSQETIGTNSAHDYFLFARDKAFIDISSHQGNDFQITRQFWARLQELTAEFNQPGRFVTFPGYEWSGNTPLGGDRNVFFLNEGQTVYRSSHALVDDLSDAHTDCHTAEKLFAALRGQDAVGFAHVGGRYADLKISHDGTIERSVEIHSGWGTFEWLLFDAFDQGYRVGIVANSDEHKGRPGASYPGASMFGSVGGLTCYLCDQLTRQAVFQAIRRRHHYATTGNRMFLQTRATFQTPSELFDEDPNLAPASSQSIDQAIMGDIIRTADTKVIFQFEALSQAPIERVEIRNGPETLATVRPYNINDLGRRIRVIWQGAQYRGRDRQTTWDGSATLIDNSFKHVRPINFFNPNKTLDRHGQNKISWKAITTGGFSGFDADLSDAKQGTLLIDTSVIKCQVKIADIGIDDIVFEGGGLDRKIRIYRLPDQNPHHHIKLSRQIDLRDTGDNQLYVHLIQEDGHAAWSSPIYIFH